MKDSQRKAMFAKSKEKLLDKLISSHAVLSKEDYHNLTGMKTNMQPYLFSDSGHLQYAMSRNNDDDNWVIKRFTNLNDQQSDYVLKNAKFRQNNW